MGKSNYIKCAALILIIGILPVFVHNQYLLSILVFAGIYAIVAIGLSMLMGYAGQISLGHAGFFAIGGYSSAILTKMHHFHPVTAMLIGAGLAIFAALIVGLPSLRLRGHYLAMATLGFGEIIYVSSGAAVGLTEGPSGFSGVPSMSVAGYVFKSELSKYFLVWTIVLIVLIVSLNIIHSRVGRALRSIHGDETAANAMGVNVARYKIQVFVYSAILASIAGSLYVHHMRFVSPTGFNLNKSILFLIMIMSGGMGSLWGAIIGASIFTLLPEFLGVFNEYDILMYGAILLGMMMFLPEGLTGLIAKITGYCTARWKTRTINNR
ncbi:branched-chain amino acid ABC transporter permease [bacterium]|nr:branched-chain amino acid ABC transporter permease [bacterium]